MLSCLGEVGKPSVPSPLSSCPVFNLGRNVFRKPSKKFFFSFGGLEGASSLSNELSFLMGMYEGIRVAVLGAGGAGGGGGGLLELMVMLEAEVLLLKQ